MSTVRVLVLAHHHGNWRVVGVDNLQLGNATRVIQSGCAGAERCIATRSHSGSTLVLAPSANEMGLLSFLTGRAKDTTPQAAAINPFQRAGIETNSSWDQTLTRLQPLILPQSVRRRGFDLPQDAQSQPPTLQLASGLADESYKDKANVARRDSFRRPKGVKLTSMLSANPKLKLQETLDSDHVVRKPAFEIPRISPMHCQAERPELYGAKPRFPEPVGRSSMSKYPYLQQFEQEIKDRKEQAVKAEWSEIRNKTSELDHKVSDHADKITAAKNKIDQIQGLVEDFNVDFDQLLSEVDELIGRHQKSRRSDSAFSAATTALLENMAKDEKEIFQRLRKDSVKEADSADRESCFRPTEVPALETDQPWLELVGDEEERRSSYSTRTVASPNSSGEGASKQKKGGLKSNIPVVSPRGTKQVHWEETAAQSDLELSPAPSRAAPALAGPSKRRVKQSAKKNEEHMWQPVQVSVNDGDAASPRSSIRRALSY